MVLPGMDESKNKEWSIKMSAIMEFILAVTVSATSTELENKLE
jgi:hypothetical protein